MGIDRPGGVGSLAEVRWATCCPGPPIWAPASENHQMTSQRGPNASQHQISTDSTMTRELSEGPNNRRESDAVPRRPAAGKRAGVVHGCMGSSGGCVGCVSQSFCWFRAGQHFRVDLGRGVLQIRPSSRAMGMEETANPHNRDFVCVDAQDALWDAREAVEGIERRRRAAWLRPPGRTVCYGSCPKALASAQSCSWHLPC